MAINKSKMLLGNQLVQKGLITREQLWEALRIQSKTGEKLGQILIRLGYVAKIDVMEIIETQKESIINLDPDVLRIIPAQLVKRYKVIPLRTEGKKLVVAMVDPKNVVAIDDLRLNTGMEIETVSVDAAELEAVIYRYYNIPNIEEDFAGFDVASYQAEQETINLDEEDTANNAPIIRLVNSIFIRAIEERASDIHVESHAEGMRIRYRIDGMLREKMQLPKKIRAAVISCIKVMSQMDIAEKRVPQDGRIKLKYGQRNIDMRVSTLPTVHGEKVVIRLLEKSNITNYCLEQIGFSKDNFDEVHEILRHSHGMVLLTGPTGSGKTTTLYAALNHLDDVEKNIITIEDPVEYMLEGINQTQVNIKAGMTFATGLRSILRQDPDIIMVGEIRDGETAEIAIRAANTGHLVLSTLHTNNAPGAIIRLVDMGIEPFLLVSSVLGVISQRLVRLICPYCRESYKLERDKLERKYINADFDEEITLYRGRGCKKCGQSGYFGRMAIHEVFNIIPQIRPLIINNASVEELRNRALETGMVSLKQDGINKAKQGLTTIQEIMRVAYTED